MDRDKIYIDRVVNGTEVSLLILDWHYKSWVGCYCKIAKEIG